MPPDLEELRRRLIKRGTETSEQIELRLVNAPGDGNCGAIIAIPYRKSVEEDLTKSGTLLVRSVI